MLGFILAALAGWRLSTVTRASRTQRESFMEKEGGGFEAKRIRRCESPGAIPRRGMQRGYPCRAGTRERQQRLKSAVEYPLPSTGHPGPRHLRAAATTLPKRGDSTVSAPHRPPRRASRGHKSRRGDDARSGIGHRDRNPPAGSRYGRRGTGSPHGDWPRSHTDLGQISAPAARQAGCTGRSI